MKISHFILITIVVISLSFCTKPEKENYLRPQLILLDTMELSIPSNSIIFMDNMVTWSNTRNGNIMRRNLLNGQLDSVLNPSFFLNDYKTFDNEHFFSSTNDDVLNRLNFSTNQFKRIIQYSNPILDYFPYKTNVYSVIRNDNNFVVQCVDIDGITNNLLYRSEPIGDYIDGTTKLFVGEVNGIDYLGININNVVNNKTVSKFITIDLSDKSVVTEKEFLFESFIEFYCLDNSDVYATYTEDGIEKLAKFNVATASLDNISYIIQTPIFFSGNDYAFFYKNGNIKSINITNGEENNLPVEPISISKAIAIEEDKVLIQMNRSKLSSTFDFFYEFYYIDLKERTILYKDNGPWQRGILNGKYFKEINNLILVDNKSIKKLEI